MPDALKLDAGELENAGNDIEIIALSDYGDPEKITVNGKRYTALAKLLADHAGDGVEATTEGEDMEKVEFEKAFAAYDEKFKKAQETIDMQVETLTKANETITAQGEQLKQLNERVEKLAAMAAPSKGKLHLVGINKSQDSGDGKQGDALQTAVDALGKMTADERTDFLIKVAQRNPSVVSAGE